MAKVTRPIIPNAGLEQAIKRRILALIDEMHRSVMYWLSASYRENEPVLAQDANAATELAKVMRELSKQWQAKFDEGAERLSEYFAEATAKRSDTALKSILRDMGLTVKFRRTAAVREILEAAVQQNVALIKSIPKKYLGDVEGMVMRSIQTGRDLKTLTQDLRKNYDVTRKRAVLIARDQNNKATSAMNRVRQMELGIERAVWMHSHAGKEPRPTHVKMHGKTYDPAKGMWDPAEQRYIWPGELINCRCTSRAVLPGFPR